MNERTRTTLLLALLSIVAAVVVVDALRGGDDAGDIAPEGDHTQRARELQGRVALVEQESDWRRALDERRAQWDEVRDASVSAATPELAVADFRAMLLDEARALDLTVDRTDRSTSRALDNVPASLDRVHELEVRFTVSSHDARALHRFIDAIEHLPGARTHVSAVTLAGPGLAQIPERVRATLTVRALGVTPAPTPGGDA
ncbi:MAG: hypothetical protein Tsb0013_20390 [Phycisphaerales bacterium]